MTQNCVDSGFYKKQLFLFDCEQTMHMENYTSFFNLKKLFTASSSCCDIIKQLASFTAGIKSTKRHGVTE